MLDGARLTAYDVLDGVSSRGAYANLLLPQLLRERQLDERDAAFATQLAYGTLRAQGTLDAILAGLVSRPLGELDPRVLDLLRLGAYQLVDLRVPSHAAVDTTVDLTRAIVGTGASGLVNAVLRKVAGGGDRAAWLETPGRRRRDPPRARHRPPPLDRATPGATPSAPTTPSSRPPCSPTTPPPRCTWWPAGPTGPRWSRSPGEQPARGRPTPSGCAGGDPGRLPSVRSGAAGVQDEGSQLAALLLTRVPARRTGRRLAGHVRRSGREGEPAGRRPARRGAAHRRRPRAAPRRAGPAGAER